jgi:hypothetical protein
MFDSSTRRGFLRSAAVGGGVLGLSSLTEFEHLVADDESSEQGRDWSVRYGDDIEPIVRLIEETPLDKCVEELAVRLRRGLSYRQFVAALFLAGLRNGGDFGYYHCIYMIHSAHQLSLDAPVDERLMSMFGGLGIFKGWQQKRYAGTGHFGWRKKPANLPTADKALAQYRSAISSGDLDEAEAAMIVLGRTSGRQRLHDLIVPYTLASGVHGWICASNTFRILPVIGRRCAEPALRMMARGFSFDKHWSVTWLAPRLEAARGRFGPLPRGWSDRRGEKAASLEFLAALRESDSESSFDVAYQQLATSKVTAGSIWDAIHLAAAEQFVIQNGDGNPLHQNTGMNALHYAFRACVDPEVRLMTLMRAVTWTAKPWGVARNIEKSKTIAQLTPADIPALPQVAAHEIVTSSATDDNAVAKAFAFARQHSNSPALWQAQRRLVFTKGGDAHAYKYLAAIWEDSQQVSPEWRAHMIASSVAGNTADLRADSPLILRAREALRGG